MDIDRLLNLNFILREHLPPWLLPPKNSFDAQRLQTLATHNIRRRIELNSPDDVLTFSNFVQMANDWLVIVTGDRMGLTEGDLRQYLAYGLVLPRYRVQPHMQALVTKRSMTFSPEGHLQKITYSKEEAFPGLRLHRARGQVTDNPPPRSPGTRDYARGTALFVFSQIVDVAGVHLYVRETVNLLTLTPKKYSRLRDAKLTDLRKFAERTGKPKFCENPQCLALVPLGHPRFCSRQCGIKGRQARKPKSTARVEKSYQRKELPLRLRP